MSLENLFNRLEKEGKLKKQHTGMDYLNGLLHAAHRNFQASSANLNLYEETAFKAAYDGLLQISRVLVLMHGYRPDDGSQHKTTFEVAAAILGKDFNAILSKIDRYRIQRNNCIYDPKILITGTEAKNILNTAKEYWHVVKAYLKSKNPQLELFDF